MIIEVITAVSGISVVLSLLFTARQTRELAKQTKLNNHIGSLGSMHDSLDMLHEIQAVFNDKPGLRPYFYDGKQCPARGRRREILINMAELFADTIDYGLMVVQLMPGTDEYAGWIGYALSMAENSPTLRDHVSENPDWYLAYWRLMTQHQQSLEAMHSEARKTIGDPGPASLRHPAGHRGALPSQRPGLMRRERRRGAPPP